MLKFFSKRINNKKGFTLIELIVVIAILAILALIAIPRVGKFRTQAAISSHNANVRTLESAASMYLAEKGIPTSTIVWGATGGTDEWKGYVADWPNVPKGTGKFAENADPGEGDPYKVTIESTDDEGVKVTVEPALIPEETTATTNP